MSDNRHGFPAFTAEEKAWLRDTCLPTETEVMLGWALPLLSKLPIERRVLVAAQIEVLDGIQEDPVSWCARALQLALEEADRDAD